jgi:hypothetical protein
MSWIEKIKNNIVLKTGDGREYNLLWRNATRSQEYNVAEFEFPGITGTLVKRSKPKGMRYNIEFYFKGEDNLDDAETFRISADDERAWILIHPFYGSLNVQPISLNYDNSTLNVTRVTGSLVETITDDRPKTSDDPRDKIAAEKVAFDDTAAAAFTNNVEPGITDINQMTANNTLAYAVGKKKVKLTVDAEAYFNAFNSANAKILEATSEPLAAIREMQSVLNAPAIFADSVRNRLDIFVNQFELLRNTLEGITERNKKRLYETNQGSVVSSMLLTASTPQDGDYGNRNDVYATIEIILESYNTYIQDIDGMQTENGGEPESFIPDAGSLIALNGLLNYTISNLFNIALDSKQERTVILENDSNPISLAHRFYNLQQDDSTITAFMLQNEMGINETLQVRKGRIVKYYI